MSEEVRRARDEDLGRCRELLLEASREEQRRLLTASTSESLQARHLRDPNLFTVVGIYADEVVGIACARIHETTGERIAILEACFVEPDARGVGVGTSLIEAVSQWSAEVGASALEARAHPGDRETKRLLEAAGFKTRLLILRRPMSQTDGSPPRVP